MCRGPRPWLQSRPPGSCRDPTPEILILPMRGGAWAHVFTTVNSDDSTVQQWGAGSQRGGLDTQRLPGRGDVTSRRVPASSCTKTRDRCASGSQRSRNLRMTSLCFRRGACSRGWRGGQYWLQAWVLGPPLGGGPLEQAPDLTLSILPRKQAGALRVAGVQKNHAVEMDE